MAVILLNLANYAHWVAFPGLQYDRVATVAETWVQWKSDFQSGSRVLKKVLWTFSFQKLLKTLKFWKSQYNLGSRPQKSPKIALKRIIQSRFTQLFELIWHIFGASTWSMDHSLSIKFILIQPFAHRLVPNPNFSCRHFWRLLLKSDLDLIDAKESWKRLIISHYKIFRMKIVKTFTSCGKAGCWVLSCDWHRGNHHLSIQPSSSSS